MSLTDQQRLYIQKNYKKLSLRNLAKELRCSRPEIEKYILTIAQHDANQGRFIPRTPVLFLALFIGLITFLTYSNSLGYSFVWDDDFQIVKNPLIKDLSLNGIINIFKLPFGIGNDHEVTSFHFRPIQLLSYTVFDHFIWRLNPMGYHLTNILLQAIAALLLFFLLLRILGDKQIVFWVCAFFAVHPVQIAAVTYISGRAESLAVIFALISFYLFYKSQRESSSIRFVYLFFSTFSFFLSLMTKEVMIMLPFLLVGYMKLFGKEKNYRIKWTDFLSYAVAVAIYLLVRFRTFGQLGEGSSGGLPVADRVLASFMAIAYYVRLLFFPYHLHMSYQLPQPQFSDPLVIAGLLTTLVLLWGVWLSRHSRVALFGWLWFWLFLIPVLNLFVLLNAPLAEHWLYNASIGAFLVIVSFLLGNSNTGFFLKKFAEPLLAFSLICFAMTTFHANTMWKDEITFFENTVKYTHQDPDVYINLGIAYGEKGLLDKAEESFKKALEIKPGYDHAIYNLKAVEQQKLTGKSHETYNR